MEQLSLMIDAGVGVLVILSAYLAMVRGFVREIFALISWIIAFFAAIYVAPMIQEPLKRVPGIGGLLENCQVLAFLSLVVVFGVALIVMGLFFYIVGGPTRRRGVGDGNTVAHAGNPSRSILDQGVGFIYGALRGLLLVSIIYIAYVVVAKETGAPDGVLPQGQHNEAIADTLSYTIVRPVAEFIWEATPEEMPGWLAGQAEALMGECDEG